MTTLTIKLAGPLQSWGAGGRFDTRPTMEAPTKSGVLGLLAAAHGVRREDPIEEFTALRFGVRLDQPGQRQRDFHTLDAAGETKVTERYYLSDAAFLAAVEGPRDLLAALVDSLHHPTFALYLGRRSCPPAGHLQVALHDGRTLEDVLREHAWVAAPTVQENHPDGTTVTILRDVRPGERGSFEQRDIPLSFAPAYRRYATRRVTRELVHVHPQKSPVLLGATANRTPTPAVPTPTAPLVDVLDPFLVFGA